MPRIELMGCPIDALDMQQTIAQVETWVKERTPRQHVVVNAAKFVEMQSDPHLRTIISACDLINADGMPVVWASRLLRSPLPCRVAGVDLFQQLVAVCAAKGYRPFFFGAEEKVVRQVLKSFRNSWPQLDIAGYRNGYYRPEEEESIARLIGESGADMLFVAFSSPKKEKFLNRWMPVMQVPFCMGVGGSFDIVAGKTRRAPLWMQQAGLEWFYRVLQEPRRMWKRYARTNPLFIWMVVRSLLQGREAGGQQGRIT
jgi:N-acetylglucosaminyldiphosphoundecaprenol N-acetyl-beta-D-mannosaminyltransferase